MKKALFMIWLVLSIQVNSAIAASSITSLNLTANQGIPHVAAPVDNIKVVLFAESDESLTKNNFKLRYFNYDFDFDVCSRDGTSYTCQYETGDMDFTSGRYTMKATMYDEYFHVLDTQEEYFYVDDEPPVIDSISLHTEGSLSALVKIQDTACSDCKGYCAGLEQLLVKVDGQQVSSEDISGCSYTANISVPVTEEGEHEICFYVTDINQKSTSRCKKTSVDFTPPQISGIQLKYRDVHLRYMPNYAIDVKIYANFTDAVSGMQSARADMSELGGSSSEMPDGCSDWVCFWKGQLEPMNGTFTASIEATDIAGNTKTATKDFSVSVDSFKPEILEIGSDFSSDYLRKQGNNITMRVAEAHSGMDFADAEMDLYRVNSGLGVEKADSCSLDGSEWLCIWSGIDAGGVHEAELVVRQAKARDDAGNINTAASVTSKGFILDAEEPEFLNVTIQAAYDDLMIAREDDVLRITAVIEEQGSGLSPENVFADYDDIYNGSGMAPAEDCVQDEDNEDLWTCTWDYAGQLEKGDILLNVIAYDDAGNRKDSLEDGKKGQIFVAGTEEREVDNFKDEVAIFDPSTVNRNFLWMSNSGTLVRVNMRLESTRGSYVHGFKMKECQGSIAGNESGYEPLTIKKRIYFPNDRKSKFIILNLPQQSEEELEDAEGYDIRCTGEIIQSRNRRSDVYTPNEEVNATFRIEFTDPIYGEPDIASLDDINEKESLHEDLETYIGYLDTWVDFLQPLCSFINLIRQLLSGACTLINGLVLVTGGSMEGAANQCFLKFEILDKAWYGKDVYQQGGDTMDFSKGAWVSSKGYMSVGFWCDLVLCEDCNKIWKDDIFGDVFEVDLNDMTRKTMPWLESGGKSDFAGKTPGEEAAGLGSYYPSVNFDPQQSLLVAVLCWPPCLTGILAKLKTYKTIIETYNTCVNLATLRGEDRIGCDDYWSAQMCRHVWMGEWWYLIDSFIQDYIAKTVLWVIEEKLMHLSECNEMTKTNSAARSGCMMARMYRVMGWFIQLSETLDTIEKFRNHKYFNQNNEEDAANAS